MNESTLVPREELSDLDWLARNVHKWPAGDHQPWCYVYMTYGGVMKAAGNFLDAVANPAMITIDQWLTRRAELQNKPSWGLSGSWSEYLAQDMDGEWKWLGENPSLGDDHWTADELRSQCKGVVIGNWYDTLEKRPEQAKPEFCESVMRSIPEPEAKPIIEQLAADYRNLLDFAKRKQEEADDAKADAEAKLAELVAAGKVLGLVLSVTGAESESEQVIIDWRDLRVGDVVWYAGDDELSSGEYHVMGIEFPDYEGYRTVLVNGNNGGHWIDIHEGWGFIRRPT